MLPISALVVGPDPCGFHTYGVPGEIVNVRAAFPFEELHDFFLPGVGFVAGLLLRLDMLCFEIFISLSAKTALACGLISAVATVEKPACVRPVSSPPIPVKAPTTRTN